MLMAKVRRQAHITSIRSGAHRDPTVEFASMVPCAWFVVVDMLCRVASTLLAFAVFGAASATAQVPSCPQDTVNTSSWISYDEGDFMVRLPPMYKRKPGRSFDSQGAAWEAAGHHVSYDYGFYSNPLTAEYASSFPGMVVCRESSDKAQARIIAFRVVKDSYLIWLDSGYGLAAHWPRVRDGLAFGMAKSLTLVGAAPNQNSAAELFAIIQSVQFKPTTADP